MKHLNIGSIAKRVTSYDKDMRITGDDGVEVRVIMHWDTNDGFEFTWLDMENRFIATPEWAQKFEDDWDKSLGMFLDNVEAHSLVAL